MAGYRLTVGAQADFRGIAQYTKREWGQEQAIKYRDLLIAGTEAIASGRGNSKDLSYIKQGLRMARCEHHYIVCLQKLGELPSIIAVLHERMDLMARIAERLR